MAIAAKRITEKEEGEKLSDEQVERISKTVIKLSEKSANGQAMSLAHNLKLCKSTKEKRGWIASYYVNCLQLLSFMGTAKSEKMMLLTDEDYEIELKMLFREKE